MPAGSEQPEGAGSAASAEVATDRVVETGSEVLESGTASTVVLTPRQPEGPPPGFVSGATSQSRRPASPPVRRRRSRTSSAPATDRVAGRAAPSEAPRASSVGPVVGQVEGGHRRRRRTSDRRGRAEEGRDVARKPPSPPTERSRSTADDESDVNGQWWNRSPGSQQQFLIRRHLLPIGLIDVVSGS